MHEVSPYRPFPTEKVKSVMYQLNTKFVFHACYKSCALDSFLRNVVSIVCKLLSHFFHFRTFSVKTTNFRNIRETLIFYHIKRSVTFKYLRFSNFMQKMEKIWLSNPENLVLWTAVRTSRPTNIPAWIHSTHPKITGYLQNIYLPNSVS